LARFGASTGWASHHRLAISSWVTLSLVAACLVALAVRSQGFPVHRAELNNGGVWVTDSDAGLVGRENKPIKQLDLRISGTAQSHDRLDILQNQEAVIAVDRSANVVTPVDTSQGTASRQDAVTVKSPEVVLGGNVVADADPNTGKVWATQVSTAGGANALDALDATSKPLATVGPRASVTVSASGTIYAASTSTGNLTTISPVGTGFSQPSSAALDPSPSGAITQMTTVGEHVVWLDANGHVGFDGHSVPVGRGAQLQQPGPDADSVLVATPSQLLTINLAHGSTTTLATTSGPTTASAPVNLGGCAWGLWASGSSGYVAQKCGNQDVAQLPSFPVAAGAELVYRVNRTNLFVNDMTTGMVWDVDGAKAEQVADWRSLKPQHHNKQDNTHHQTSNQPAKPQAVKDTLGARAGDTTVLHVLDNDKAPKGDTLAVTAVKNTNQQLTVAVAPDQQSLLATVDPGVASGTPLSFTYTIDDGETSNNSATGTVALTARSADDQPQQPQLRQNYKSSKPPAYPVAAGGSIDIPVLADWRDRANGDPVSLVPGSVRASIGKASITPDGVVRYVAPDGGSGSPVSVSYETTTGATPNRGSATVRIYSHTQTAPPIAEPDVSAGDVGAAIAIHPLDNDVAGADPVDPTAALVLSGSVAPQPGVTVKTDTATGTVTVIGRRPGSYTLPYRVAYGSAAGTSGNKLRVIVRPSSKTSNTPIAMPDTTAVHGSAPMLVDVLANDYDPQGRLLAVQQATSSDSGEVNLDVAVVDGRWIRVSNPAGEARQKPAVVDYTVSNGHATASGTLTVSLLPAIDPLNDAPDAEPDVVTVRAGTSADIPVLDNDSTPSGDPVGLVIDSRVTPGTLPVIDGPGAAYLDGKTLRFVAPATVTRPTDTHVSYTVENTAVPDAGQTSGLITVHITPPPDAKTNPDQDPTPSDLEGRVVEGDTVTLKLPLTGQDPDGDPVTVSGIGDPDVAHSTPQLGEIVGYSADTISYQAFPGQTGEDQFTYTVADPSGQTGEATVRVAVVPPGAPASPVAVDDSVTADPSRDLSIDVLANDLIPQGTTPTFERVDDARDGVTGSDGIISVKPQPRRDDLVVPYSITNGLTSPSGARLTVHFRPGFDNPPTAGTVTATPTAESHSVTADVLAKVDDIDDPRDHLALDSVDGLPASAMHGGSVTLPVSPHPRVWTYHVRDAEGARAVGSIYEAGQPTATPYLKKGAVLHLAPGKSTTVDIAKFVVTPQAGTRPYLTTDNEIFQAPSRMFAGPISTPSQTSIKVTAGTATGPATLSFQVSDQKNFNSKSAHTAMLTIPVVVGDPQPTLTCPDQPIDVPESGVVTLQIAAICHLWQPPGESKKLTFSASKATSTNGISVGSDNGEVTVKAMHAKVGSQGALDVRVDGYPNTARLPFVVIQMPPPVLQQIPVLHPKAGQTATVDLARFLVEGGVRGTAFDPAVVSVTPTNGGPAAHYSGTTVSVTPPPNEHRTYTYRVEMSDSGRNAGQDRIATGTLSVQVTDVPHFTVGAKPAVLGNLPQSGQVTLRWPAADPYGSPLLGYNIAGGPGTKHCATTICTIKGLKNGTQYNFTVTATNSNGTSHPIGPVTAEPNAVPTAVKDLRIVSESDRRITYSWSPPTGDGFSAVTGYLLSWTGNPGYKQWSSAEKTVTVPNGEPITFSVRPVNEMYAKYNKFGPATSLRNGMASGRPAAPRAPSVSGTNVAGGGTKAFTVSWPAVDPNGRGKTHYSLLDNGKQVSCGGSAWTTSTSCPVEVPNNGNTHAFKVRAANDAGVTPNQWEGSPQEHQSGYSSATSATAAGTPGGFTNVSLTATGKDADGTFGHGDATLKFTVGPSNGKSGIVTCSGSAQCRYEVGPNGGPFTKTITGLTNGANSTLTLTYCNGANVADTGLGINPCVSSPQVSTVTYGPIGQPSITATANGTSISVDASVDANGANVSMTIKDTNNGASHDCGTSDSGSFACAWTETGLAYSTTYRYTVTVTDASGHGRPPTSNSAQATTRAPNPTLSVSWGGIRTTSYCGDASHCRIVHINGSELPPGQITIWYDTDCAASTQTQVNNCKSGQNGGTTHYVSAVYNVDSNGNLSVDGRSFGYIGAHVWVDTTAYGKYVESNHIQCP
jgi:hypothetical protein